MKRAIVTGGAGFVGSNLADRLLADGVEVVIYDNLSTGQREFIADALAAGATFVEGDVLDFERLQGAIDGCDVVFHLQANADVRHGLERTRVDIQQNTLATSNVLEAMRLVGTRTIAFFSTGSVYGEPTVFPTPEDAPFPIQTSLYAASKLAGEGLIGAYAHGFGFTGVVFRSVSILGERYTHGHVIDFYRALRDEPTRLRVLGDGRQRKSYVYVGDCIDAVLTAVRANAGTPGMQVYNVGTDDSVIVDESIGVICSHLGLDPELEHTGGARGWAGDSPLIHLDTTKIQSLGWTPTVTIADALRSTVDWLDAHQAIVEATR